MQKLIGLAFVENKACRQTAFLFPAIRSGMTSGPGASRPTDKFVTFSFTLETAELQLYSGESGLVRAHASDGSRCPDSISPNRDTCESALPGVTLRPTVSSVPLSVPVLS